eukprot:c24230_g1_i2 orf=334-1056(-)
MASFLPQPTFSHPPHTPIPPPPTSLALHPSSPPPLFLRNQQYLVLCRRELSFHGLLNLLGCSFVLQSLHCDAAYGFSFVGIPGPKEWLKGQKKRTAQFLLAPIIASWDKLNSAQLLLTSSISSREVKEVQKSVRAASCDCMAPEAGSFVAFQIKSGIEVCTFRLILKNAASLLDDRDPVTLRAYASLDNLIGSFIYLDQLLSSAVSETSLNREDLTGAFIQTKNALNAFEEGVRECLGIS